MCRIFGRAFPVELLKWYETAPHGPNCWYGAFDVKQPIALYGLLPIRVLWGGRAWNARLCNNVGVLPEYQGTGLFQALGEFALADAAAPVILGVPNKLSVNGHKRIGWRTYGTLELLGTDGPVPDAWPDGLRQSDFVFVPDLAPAPFQLDKDETYWRWRYAKPGMNYFQTFFGPEEYAIWKIYQGRIQIMQTSDPALAARFGGATDIWQLRGSCASESLKALGFQVRLRNELLLYTKLEIKDTPYAIKIELADNDVF